MLYYDGRFENSQYLIYLLFNQIMRHCVIRKVDRAGSSQKKVLKELLDLLKNVEFKKALADAAENPTNKESI